MLKFVNSKAKSMMFMNVGAVENNGNLPAKKSGIKKQVVRKGNNV